MSTNRVDALNSLMPLGGWSDDGTTVTVHADGITKGYSTPTQAEIDNQILANTPPTIYHLWDGTAWLEDIDHAKEVRMNEFRDMREELWDMMTIKWLTYEQRSNPTQRNIVAGKANELRDMPQNETWSGLVTFNDVITYTPAILLEDLTLL
ncbi:hypothetical protein KAR91_03185 [Candidatus Pacearchaeota archaeon]|nr:hypothetical protein [Candidatus Pacearchaeota archaeon]